MKLLNSVCTNLAFPQSRGDISEFSRMARFLSDMGMHSVEFYHDGNGRGGIGSVLSDAGLDGIYIGVIPSKEQKRYLCDEDEDARRDAVELFRACIDEADSWGVEEVMCNSGRAGKDVERGLSQLFKSLEELYSHIARKNLRTRLLMEPCDTWMDAMHLIGDYRRALAFVRRADDGGLPLRLTMDSAHTAEEGEDYFEALSATRAYCSHIHFANCLISDSGSPLYGDKHLGYEYPGTVWTPETLGDLFERLKGLYPGEDTLRIGLEVLCREDDPYAYFERMWESLPFLHQ